MSRRRSSLLQTAGRWPLQGFGTDPYLRGVKAVMIGFNNLNRSALLPAPSSLKPQRRYNWRVIRRCSLEPKSCSLSPFVGSEGITQEQIFGSVQQIKIPHHSSNKDYSARLSSRSASD